MGYSDKEEDLTGIFDRAEAGSVKGGGDSGDRAGPGKSKGAEKGSVG